VRVEQAITWRNILKYPNVLIVCEHASSKFGGEAMLPLNYFLLLSKRLPRVFLLTHERTRKDIEATPGINPEHVFYIPDTSLHKFLNRISHQLPDRIASVTSGAAMHLVTQLYQWVIARRIVRELGIDVIHEPAPVSPKQPSMMFALRVPVIIGPMNGGMSFPAAFAHMSGSGERWVYGAMRMFSSLYNVLIPGKLFAAMLLVANSRTKKALPLFKLGQVVELVENGVFASKVRSDVKSFSEDPSVKVVYVGRLIDLKMVDIVIEAVGRCSNPQIRLTIVGDGVERDRLERYAESVAFGKVTFSGAVPHEKILECYDRADIFVLPSVRECGGAVVLEAMARGLPVIATNWGGPADYITSDTGILIDPVSREHMVAQFARNIDRLASSAELRLQYGRSALARVSGEYLWESKIDAMIDIYQKVCQQGA
jgi:glycosyltransferase involved in cell wall biosynthesis